MVNLLLDRLPASQTFRGVRHAIGASNGYQPVDGRRKRFKLAAICPR